MLLIRLLGVLSLCYCLVAERSPTEDNLLKRFRIPAKCIPSAFVPRPAISAIKHGVAHNNKVDGVVRKLVVKTEKGNIKGQTNAYAHSFFGIPYAEPPKRFEAPVEVGFRENIDASEETRLACFQRHRKGSKLHMSEDCLVLNIHVPRSVTDESLTTDTFDKYIPVMFWIHGGGFISGAGTAPLYDARYLSNSTNTVVVTINYRLSALGFIVLEEGSTTYGNQGFKDQQLALKWVHENIIKFGGDPKQVTIVGESAGAQSVMLHLASTVNDLYFKRAIMESNPAVYQYLTKDQAKRLADHLFKFLGFEVLKLRLEKKCPWKGSHIECLRKVEPSKIIKAAGEISLYAIWADDSQSIVEPFRPYVDGVEFTEQPFAMFEDGKKWNNEVDVILGTNRQELGLLNCLFQYQKKPLSRIDFKLLNIELVKYHETETKITKEYSKLASKDTYGDIFGKEVGDLYFVCSTRKLARSISNTSTSENNYLYSWEHARSGDPKSIWYYSGHGLEVPYVFNTANYTQQGKEADMVKMFSDLWGSFAYTGIPTSADFAEEWPRYTKHEDNSGSVTWKNLHMIYPSAVVEDNYMDDLCNFWDDMDLYANILK